MTGAALSLLLRRGCVLCEHTKVPDNAMYAAAMCAQTGGSDTGCCP